ncbi:MAG: LuxR C-terminal-related transcriptional regulator [Blastomonas sp.]
MTARLILYAIPLGIAAALLQWIEYRHFVRLFATETYIILIAIAFTALGIWLGTRLSPASVAPDFIRNDAALAALQISPREYETLELLAAGHSNKEIARLLDVSPNTVKTHVASLFEKLEVNRRTQAIGKAKELRLLP